MTRNLLGLGPRQLEAYCTALGERPFRARQLLRWIHQAGVDDFGAMTDMSKALRKGKVFIDWSQNDRNKTTVCTWSMRGKEQPSVSYPLKWADVPKLKTAMLHPDKALKADDTEFRRIYHKVQQLPDLG